MLTVSVAHLLSKADGSREDYTLQTRKLEVSEYMPELAQTLKMNLIMYKIDQEISTELRDISTGIKMTCDKCMQPYLQSIHVDQTERIFYLKRPSPVEDADDLYLINKHKLTITLDEWLRQEILLHFPSRQVCSKSCKGLCQICGKNRNLETCACKKEIPEESVQYFRDLKQIYYHSDKK